MTARSRREALASAIDRLLDCLDAPPSLARVSPSGRALRANVVPLRALATCLRGPSPVYAQGVAMLGLLLRDGTGPLYLDHPDRPLGAALGDVRRALAGAAPPTVPRSPRRTVRATPSRPEV